MVAARALILRAPGANCDIETQFAFERAGAVARQREAGEFTLPTTIAIELATNPFLRADDPDIQAGLGMAGADPVAVFTELRERKNKM